VKQFYKYRHHYPLQIQTKRHSQGSRQVNIKTTKQCYNSQCYISYHAVNIQLIKKIINVRKKPKEQSSMDNPETLATLGTQDTEWTIQRHWQH